MGKNRVSRYFFGPETLFVVKNTKKREKSFSGIKKLLILQLQIRK